MEEINTTRRQEAQTSLDPDQLYGNYQRVQGAYPGYYNIDTNKQPTIRLYSYNQESFFENNYTNLKDLFTFLDEHHHLKHWIDIEGIGNTEFFQEIQKKFRLHNLAIEDTVSGEQRPKVETYDNFLFIISRMLYYLRGEKLINEQLAFFMFNNTLITIQDEFEDCLDPVRERLRNAQGTMRQRSTFYLTYAIVDAIIDNYFSMTDMIHDQLEKLERQIIEDVNSVNMNDILHIKKEILLIRKAALAERDKISELMRCEYALKDDRVEIYLRDTYDHCLQILELLDDEKEIAYSLVDAYNSNLNNKTNEVMKVLTIVSSIFIPLTFIAGIYGMNFAPEDHDNKYLPFNMPELYHPLGYVIVWGIMIAIVIAQVIYFKRKKWF